MVGLVAALCSCSTVGPGLKNHPGDCAIGISWADCLPGTPGYNNGGGRIHREEAKRNSDAVVAAAKSVGEQCMADMASPDLDPIRPKAELFRPSLDATVPFEIASNDSFPTEAEKPVIAKWATLRDGCLKRNETLVPYPQNAAQMQIAFIERQRAFSREAAARTGDLVVALYQQKLTYGEFAHKRYEIGRDAAAAELAFRQSALEQDDQRQMQAQQIAQQQFDSRLAAWSTYLQAVNAREPLTVHVDGTVRVTR